MTTPMTSIQDGRSASRAAHATPDSAGQPTDPKTKPQVTNGIEPERDGTNRQLSAGSAQRPAPRNGFDSRQLHNTRAAETRANEPG
jgi:hypothetical protein